MMENMRSFRGYGKVNHTLAEEEAYRCKQRRRLVIIIVSIVLLAIVIVAVVVGIVKRSRNHDGSSSESELSSSISSDIKLVCKYTQYPTSCLESLSAEISHRNITHVDPISLFKLSLEIAKKEVEKILSLPSDLAQETDNNMLKGVLQDCQHFLSNTIDEINAAIDSVPSSNKPNSSKIIDLRSWLTSAIIDMETCLVGFEDMNEFKNIRVRLVEAMNKSKEYTSNSLAIVSKILNILRELPIPFHRKLLDFPEWVSSVDRKLLQQTVNVKYNVTVAQDGSGQFKTISEALKLVPLDKEKKGRFVIYIKAGKYFGNVTVTKEMFNIMMIGDGSDKTIITGSMSVGGKNNLSTYNTATFVVEGQGFIARDIAFENTAGPKMNQSVAVRVTAKDSVFYKCAFYGYQDTLYVHKGRQFYRDCDVIGTVDFIFGFAPVVFQNCRILPRQPLSGQQNTITAQGKSDPNMISGISIHNCNISNFDNVTAKTYLGRPWKAYSTTVVMQTDISEILDSPGWLPWNNTETIFYGEYQNRGEGAKLSGRVNWKGYVPALTDKKAAEFSVTSLIQGNEWLPSTGITFMASLSN